MLNINLERIRRLIGKRYYEGLNLTEIENLRELEEMKIDDEYWNGQINI